MAQQLGNVTVGSIVKLNENGSPVDYLVVHQGKPSSLYDDSCDGTWLLRKDIYAKQQWNSSNNNTFTSATINATYLPSLLALYDTDIQSIIKTVKIPYCVGGGSGTVNSGASGYSCQLFLLSGYEVGWTQSNSPYFPVDGMALSYFTGGMATVANRRLANYNGSVADWWLRSPGIGGNSASFSVTYTGDYINYDCSGSLGIRPAMVLPSNLFVQDDGSIFTIGSPTLTAPTTAVQTQSISLSWSSVSGATSYQLQCNTGSSWETIYTGPNTSYEDTAGNWSSVQYQVCALVDTVQGVYSDSQTVTILPPSAVPTINSISTVNLTESFTITWNSAANADSYVLQRNIGSGWEEVYSGANLQYQDQALYSNMSYRVASVITDLYQSAWSPEYIVDINGQMIEMNIKNDDGSYEAIYPKTLIGNIAGLGDWYFTKDETLQNSTAALFNLGLDAVPDEVLKILGRFNSGLGNDYLWIKQKTSFPENPNYGNIGLVYDSNPTVTIKYADNFSDLYGGNYETITVTTSTQTSDLQVLLDGKFFSTFESGWLNYSDRYCQSTESSAIKKEGSSASNAIYVTNCNYVYSYGLEVDNFGYVNSPSQDAYPPATPDGYTYTALGQVGNKAQIETGSYTGTGKAGKTNPNTLTFGFEPKIIIIGNDRGGVYINFYFWGAVKMNGANNYANENIVSTSNYTISWYHPSDVSGQLNASGITYNYIAIG